MTAYQPLFLKYRPQQLSDILGQISVKQTLTNAINSQKIVHAYLLTGPRGSGKTSTARILAKSLNCLEPLDGRSPTIEPCGSCASCQSIANSSSVDVTEIDAASHGHVDDARKLIEKVNLASITGKYRVYIIDEVHMLTNAAFNALLKVIEEPPANVVFVLATTELDKVPKTIASRCQQLKFKPIITSDARERLEFVAQKEQINIEAGALDLIAQKADGAMRDALALLDQVGVFSSADQAIDVNQVLQIVGGVSLDDLQGLCSSILLRDLTKLLTSLDAIVAQGREPLLLCQELSGFFLDLLQALNTSGEDSKVYCKDLVSLCKEQNIENFELVQIIDSLADLELRLKQSTQTKALLKAWFTKLALRQDMLIIKDLLKRVEALEQGDSRPQVAKPVVEAPKLQVKEFKIEQPSTMAKTSPAVQSSDNSAESFLAYLSPGSRGMYISSKAKLASTDGSKAVIAIPEKFKFLKSKLEVRQEEFVSALSKDLNKEVQSLEFVISDIVQQESIATISKVEEPAKPTSQPGSPVQTITQSANPLEGLVHYQPSKQTGLLLDEVAQATISLFGGKQL